MDCSCRIEFVEKVGVIKGTRETYDHAWAIGLDNCVHPIRKKILVILSTSFMPSISFPP